VFRSCLVGAAVTFALIAIPVVHWVTALPSPFIGGYFAGIRASATTKQAFLIGSIIALLLVVPVAGALLVVSLIFKFSAQVFMVIGAVYLVYAALLASLGAIVGGASARRQPAG